MAKTDSMESNPALKSLEGLVGDWNMELSNAAFLPNPSDIAKGHLSFEWLENGAFLVMRMGDKPPKRSDAVWLISRDDSDPNYKVLYYDARNISRIYQMSFVDNVWKMWREAPGFFQRYTGRLSPDSNVIEGMWEKSPDGSTWEHDFDVTYKRVTKTA